MRKARQLTSIPRYCRLCGVMDAAPVARQCHQLSLTAASFHTLSARGRRKPALSRAQVRCGAALTGPPVPAKPLTAAARPLPQLDRYRRAPPYPSAFGSAPPSAPRLVDKQGDLRGASRVRAALVASRAGTRSSPSRASDSGESRRRQRRTTISGLVLPRRAEPGGI